MKVKPQIPPRKFRVGKKLQIEISDCGKIQLDPDSQVTFITEDQREYDVARKSWGFYATPSLNDRLKKFGFRPVLIKNAQNKFFIFLVEEGKEPLFESYLKEDELQVVYWLDSEAALLELERKIR